MNATSFSKGQRVTGEFKGQGYTGVITDARFAIGRHVSVKLDAPIQVRGEKQPRDFFMTRINAAGNFTNAGVQGYIALVSEDVQPTDAPAEVDMGGDFEGFVEAVNAPRAEPTRIKQLRDRIASQERELIDLRLELSQLLGGK